MFTFTQSAILAFYFFILSAGALSGGPVEVIFADSSSESAEPAGETDDSIFTPEYGSGAAALLFGPLEASEPPEEPDASAPLAEDSEALPDPFADPLDDPFAAPGAEPSPDEAPAVAVVEPTPLTFVGLAQKPHLWPTNLVFNLETRVPILFNGKNYGHVDFITGQTLTIDSLKESGEILGTMDGTFLSVSASQTNLLEWFKAEYGSLYSLELGEVERTSIKATGAVEPAIGAANDVPIGPETEPPAEFSRFDFMAEMRYWCYMNFGYCRLEVGEDSLVLYWLPKGDAPVNFRMEARELARRYLIRQAELGGTDNYAACVIRHPSTQEILGSGSIYIPQLTTSGGSSQR